MNQSGPAAQQCAVGNELYLHAAFITYIHEFIETGMTERLSLDMKINIRSNISYLQDDFTEKAGSISVPVRFCAVQNEQFRLQREVISIYTRLIVCFIHFSSLCL